MYEYAQVATKALCEAKCNSQVFIKFSVKLGTGCSAYLYSREASDCVDCTITFLSAIEQNCYVMWNLKKVLKVWPGGDYTLVGFVDFKPIKTCSYKLTASNVNVTAITGG